MTDDREPARKNWDAYVRARDSGHDVYVREAARFEDFYYGDQWSDEELANLGDRPALTINQILSTVNAMLGERINKRMELRYAPTRGGTAELANNVLTPLVRHIQEDNQYHYVEGELFLDGLVKDRGFLDVRMDFSDDMRGEVRITKLDPRVVIPDPLARDYDTRKWNEVTTTYWMTLDEVELEYGEAARRKVEVFATSGTYAYGYEQDCIEWSTRDAYFGDPDEIMPENGDRSWADVARVRVIDRQYRKLGWARVFVDPTTGDMREIPEDMTEERIDELAQTLGLSVTRQLRRRVRWTVSVGDVTLFDEWSPYRWFTVVMYAPYFIPGRPFGVVRNLISPQQQLNKSESQELHIINTTANSGWDIEAGQLVNMTEEELEERGAETGLVVVRKPGTPPLNKIQPNTVPSGISNVGAKAAGAIRAISGVYDAMLGDSGPEISGIALETKLSRGLVQLQVPFDNLNRTRMILGEMLYNLIRDYYTEERVYYVADFNTPGHPVIPVELNKQAFDGSVINDIAVGEYGVTVDIGPSHTSVQDQQFGVALELRKAGIAVPDYAVVENSPLGNRHEVAQLLRQMQGFAEPTPEQQQLAQIQMEFQLQMMQAELLEKQARAMLMQAQAGQAQAKAGETQGDLQLRAAEMEMQADLKLRELNQRWMEFQANLENKLQLAGIHSQNKDQSTRFSTLAKQTMHSQKLLSDERKASLQAAVQVENARQKAAQKPVAKPTSAAKSAKTRK